MGRFDAVEYVFSLLEEGAKVHPEHIAHARAALALPPSTPPEPATCCREAARKAAEEMREKAAKECEPIRSPTDRAGLCLECKRWTPEFHDQRHDHESSCSWATKERDGSYEMADRIRSTPLPDAPATRTGEGEESNLVRHAESELRRAGMFDADADYGGMLGKAVMKLIRAHAEEGHSGFSHSMAVRIFADLANFKTLTPICSDPSEWMEVDAGKMWQSTRSPSVFSKDGGATWYDIDAATPQSETGDGT